MPEWLPLVVSAGCSLTPRGGVRDDEAVAVELPAGGVLFFNFGILHCTHGNRNDRERAGLALHFINGDYTTAEFVADACVVPITDCEGRRVTGSEDHHAWENAVVPRAIAAH